jgi:hypothetical protein
MKYGIYWRLHSYQRFMQLADYRPTETRVRVMKIKNSVLWDVTPCSLVTISRILPNPPALMTDRKIHTISARIIPLSGRCLRPVLLTSFLGRFARHRADVLRTVQQIGLCASSAERERDRERTRAIVDQEAETKQLRRNSSSCSGHR